MGTSSFPRVRRATAADALALARIAAITFPLACPPTTTDAAKADFIDRHLNRAAFDRYLADPFRVVLLIEDESGPVGYSMLVRGEPSDEDVRAAVLHRPVVELSKFYLLPGLHGSGYAAALMAASVAEAERDDVSAIWLGVNQHNARANRFYEKSGFLRVGVKRFLVGEVWEDDFVRLRSLSATPAA